LAKLHETPINYRHFRKGSGTNLNNPTHLTRQQHIMTPNRGLMQSTPTKGAKLHGHSSSLSHNPVTLDNNDSSCLIAI